MPVPHCLCRDPLNSQELHRIRKTGATTALLRLSHFLWACNLIKLGWWFKKKRRKKTQQTASAAKAHEFSMSLCSVSGGFWHGLVYGFRSQVHPPVLSWTNPIQLLCARSLSCTDGGCSRQPQLYPGWWGPGDTLGSTALLALKMKGLMKLYLMKLYLNSNIWPPPLLFQLSVISKTLTFTCWQQFWRFWVVSFTKTELSCNLTKFSCTRCLSTMPGP